MNWLNRDTWERDGVIEFAGAVSPDEFQTFLEDEGIRLPPGRLWQAPRSYYVTVEPNEFGWDMQGMEIWNFALPGPGAKRVTIVRQTQDPEYRGPTFRECTTPDQLAMAMEGK